MLPAYHPTGGSKPSHNGNENHHPFHIPFPLLETQPIAVLYVALILTTIEEHVKSII